MIPAAVRYLRAGSLEEAFTALAEDDAKVLAGGHSLLPVLKLRVVRPPLLVDIGGLELDEISAEDGGVHIGALVTWAELEDASELRRPGLAAISDCSSVIGDLQVRNRGTIGGSLAHADPASDMPAVLLALGATLELRSAAGERRLAASEFFSGPFSTALAERELIAGVTVPTPPAGSGSAYAKVEHPASGFALAGAAALVRPDGKHTVALTGVGAVPFLLPDGDPAETIAAAEIYGDEHAPEDYRRQLARVVVERALGRARERMKDGG